ncbi:MAG: SH3 domain-containing protein [Nitrospinae bacterium]|nr:SH3 domain-containing protein [Nitrospinota bacterium]
MGVLPWQETIDYVNLKGGMTFWHHLESLSGIGKKGPVFINTPSHSEDLVRTYGYTGFQAVYEDTIHITDPGKEWDTVLNQYCDGIRDGPVWGIGGLDYHGEGESGIKLKDVKTIFLLKEKNKNAALKALRDGKVYSVRQGDDYRLILDEFLISDPSGKKALSGDEIDVQGSPHIYMRVSATDGKRDIVEVQLIRKGEIIKKYSSETPFEMHFDDEHLLDSEQGKFKSGDKIYYRLNIYGKRPNYIISNPIFVKLFPEMVKEPPAQLDEAKTTSLQRGVTGNEKKVEFIIIEKVSAMRSGPGSEHEKIGRVDKGERFEIISIERPLFRGRPWYKVKYKDKGGFIWGGLARKE